MTKLMEGKKGILFGVSNKFGIAYAIAEKLKKQGAEIAFTYANEAMEKRVRPIAEEMDSKMCVQCDVTNEQEMEAVFKEYEKTYGKIDFMLHAVAFANKEDLMGEFIDTSIEGWNLALQISAYSLVSMCRHARPLFNDGASVLAMTYLASEKVVPNYNVMAIAKSALECSSRYLAMDLGKNNVRVNCISAGAIKTMAARGIAGFDKMLHAGELRSPMGRCVSLDDVGKTGLYLLSDLSSGVTGEVVHVDCGCHSVYNSLAELEAMLNKE